jgi:hypothetical protein
LQRDDLLALGKKWLTRMFRTTLFARDEVLVFAHKEAQASEDHKISVRPGTFAELAALAVEHSDGLDAPRLHIARERLKHGDLVYVAQDGDDSVHLVWMRTGTEVTAPEVGSKCRIELDKPVSLIYDCWTLPLNQARELSPGVLRQLVTRAPKEHRQVWIYCRSDDAATQRGLEAAGFQLRHRMGQLRILHWFSRQWVR